MKPDAPDPDLDPRAAELADIDAELAAAKSPPKAWTTRMPSAALPLAALAALAVGALALLFGAGVLGVALLFIAAALFILNGVIAAAVVRNRKKRGWR